MQTHAKSHPQAAFIVIQFLLHLGVQVEHTVNGGWGGGDSYKQRNSEAHTVPQALRFGWA